MHVPALYPSNVLSLLYCFWTGGNRARHLRLLGQAARLTGAAEPVPHPHGDSEGADAAPRHPGPHPAPRPADAGSPVPKYHHTKPGDHLLVLHPEAAGEHAQEPHCHGANVIMNMEYTGVLAGSSHCSVFPRKETWAAVSRLHRENTDQIQTS